VLAVKLDTGFNIEVEFHITAFHRRLLAWVIDFLIQLSYLWLTAILFSRLNVEWSTWGYVLYLMPTVFYHLLLEIMMNGQSIGKKAMHIKVITLEGGQPSISQYIIRWMFRLFDIGLFFIPGFFSVVLTERSQRVGDIIAGTIVIDTKPRTSWQDTIFTVVETTYKPRYSEVMQLTDRDINTLKSIIETIRRKNDYELAFRISERIQSKLNIRAQEDPFDFLQILMKDYNYYSTNN
jgi:uncharacterized RDD family membrane protein YckC